MSLYDWLLFFHITGTFLLIGGLVAAAVLNLAAIGKRRRPSEIVLLYGLVRPAVAAIGVGLIVTLLIGLWLVNEAGYGYGDAWIITAIVLWVIGSWLGNAGGKHQRETRLMAQNLAARDDVATPELQARVRNPVPLALSYASGLVALAILAIMIWKPGA